MDPARNAPLDDDGRRSVRSLALFLFVTAALTLWVFHQASHGFCPTDEGYVLAQAHRLLHGQVPHRDFISPRPVGSAVLHLVDLAMPWPLMAGSRLIALLEIVAYSTALAMLIFRRGPREWTTLESIAWGASLLVNVHGFPLMAWYTVDGILLLAVGLLLVDRGVTRRRLLLVAIGFVLLGAAPLTKQSFFAAPLLGLVRVLAASATPLRERLRTAAVAVAVGIAPGLLYLVVVVAAGGLAPLLDQLLGTRPAWGTELLRPFFGVPSRQIALLLAAIALLDVTARRSPLQVWKLATWSLRAWMTYLIVDLALRGQLTWVFPRYHWGTEVFWALALVALWDCLRSLRVDGVAVALLVIGWMVALSWSATTPNLIAGSLTLAAVWIVWRGAPLPEASYLRTARSAVLVAALAVLVLTGRTFAYARTFPYYDGRPEETTVDLGTIVPGFRGIWSNPTTAEQIGQIRDCIELYPSSRVAVLPDNAWVYPVLGVENALPLDWFYVLEYFNQQDRVLEAAERLGREGGFLVLFQTVPAFNLSRAGKLMPASKGNPPGFFLGARIAQFLGGRKIVCGSFSGRWSPGPPRAVP